MKETIILNIWTRYGGRKLITQWEWDKEKDWKTEFLKRWGNFNGSQDVKNIIYQSQGLRIALDNINKLPNSKVYFNFGWRIYDKKSYNSIEFR